jgi:hypothetical protein
VPLKRPLFHWTVIRVVVLFGVLMVLAMLLTPLVWRWLF